MRFSTSQFIGSHFNRVRVALFRNCQSRRGPLVLVQDRAPLHRVSGHRELFEDFDLPVYELPAYAPELNPVEHLWGWTKDKQLANFVPDPADLDQLAIVTEHVTNAAEHDQRRMQSFL